jgi:hypothetical protein
MRMVKVEEAERQQLRKQVADMHQFREQRLQQERQGARERAAGGAAARPRPMNLPHSPIASRPAHPAGSQAAIAHREEGAHPTASHSETARRSDMLKESARAGRSGQEAAAGSRAQPRPGTARPGARPPARPAPSSNRERERARSNEEPERRRSP